MATQPPDSQKTAPEERVAKSSDKPMPMAQRVPESSKKRSIDQILANMETLATERQAEKANVTADEQLAEDASRAKRDALVAKRERDLMRRYASNTSIQTRLAAAERDLNRLEGQGYFASYPIKPQNEFPTLLTRLPIFRPTRRRRQHKLQDVDNALSFSTPFGDGKRHGPPLTVRDEDTLIALTRLRSKRLYGRPQQLPIEIADIYESKAGRVGVHYAICSIDDVVRQLGLTDGGENYKRTFQSIKRLGATTLELNLKTHERYLGSIKTGRMLQLIHVQWQVYDRDGLLLILFPPVIAQWLENEYTYIDWKIRLQLDDLGKCLHRFLSGQPKRYQTQALKLADTVGYDGPRKNLKQRIGRSLDKLIELGWLKSYTFSGNGRSIPLTIQIER